MAIGLFCFLAGVAVIFGGSGFLAGYFAGRSAGRREQQRGFAVLPAGSGTPGAQIDLVAPVAPVVPTAEANRQSAGP